MQNFNVLSQPYQKMIENHFTRIAYEVSEEHFDYSKKAEWLRRRKKVRAGLIDGDVKEGSLLAGQIAGMINDIKPVKAIINDIVTEAEDIIRNRLMHNIWKE